MRAFLKSADQAICDVEVVGKLCLSGTGTCTELLEFGTPTLCMRSDLALYQDSTIFYLGTTAMNTSKAVFSNAVASLPS